MGRASLGESQRTEPRKNHPVPHRKYSQWGGSRDPLGNEGLLSPRHPFWLFVFVIGTTEVLNSPNPTWQSLQEAKADTGTEQMAVLFKTCSWHLSLWKKWSAKCLPHSLRIFPSQESVPVRTVHVHGLYACFAINHERRLGDPVPCGGEKTVEEEKGNQLTQNY